MDTYKVCGIWKSESKVMDKTPEQNWNWSKRLLQRAVGFETARVTSRLGGSVLYALPSSDGGHDGPSGKRRAVWCLVVETQATAGPTGRRVDDEPLDESSPSQWQDQGQRLAQRAVVFATGRRTSRWSLRQVFNWGLFPTFSPFLLKTTSFWTRFDPFKKFPSVFSHILDIGNQERV